MISLYFHFPFCTRKCPYCHFYVIPNKEDHKQAFLPALLNEWKLYAPQIEAKEITSLYFGGGTPTLFLEGIEAILERCHPSCEITVETNPEDVTPELMSHLKKIGINRVSIGVQTLDNTLLKHLGRTHTATQAIDAVYMTKDAGIDNITIDLMYELPHQTVQLWEQTLERTSSLPITHLSLYNLVFEPHTLFHKKQESLSPYLPSDEEAAQMLQMAVNHFETMGLKRYEISAFGKPSIHNTGYWTGRPFIGMGPSAFSYMEGRRFRNVCSMNKYMKKLDHGEYPIDFEERLEPLRSLHERLAIGLRLINGVRMPNLPFSTQSILKELEGEGFLTYKKDHITLSEKGLLFYDTVAESIVL